MTKQTVIVTGASGLLGREVSTAFETAGHSVHRTGYARADGVNILKVDLEDDTAVKKLLNELE